MDTVFSFICATYIEAAEANASKMSIPLMFRLIKAPLGPLLCHVVRFHAFHSFSLRTVRACNVPRAHMKPTQFVMSSAAAFSFVVLSIVLLALFSRARTRPRVLRRATRSLDEKCPANLDEKRHRTGLHTSITFHELNSQRGKQRSTGSCGQIVCDNRVVVAGSRSASFTLNV